MSPLEIAATLLTILSVFLTVKIKWTNYPVGIVSTGLFFFVFWQAKLYSSAWLQVYFVIIQLYGWWFWLKGDKGHEPRVSTWPIQIHLVVLGIGLSVSFLIGELLARYTDAKMALMDAFIFGLSVVAQFLLDRKKIENWIAWAVVNVISIWVYYSQGLMVTTGLYVLLLINTIWGYRVWKKEMNGYVS